MRIILFGFEKFGSLTCNPSQLVVEELARQDQPDPGYELITLVLPTEYAASEEIIKNLIQENNPSLVVGLGVSASRQTICLERFALNIDDVDVADNAGCVRSGNEIEPGGPAALTTTFDLPPILKKLTDRGIAATISNHAGTYVCNHVYYQALRTLQTENGRARCVFVHLPGLGDEILAGTDKSSQWTTPKLVEAVELVILELVRD